MNWFRNLAVARKLAVAFSFTALITLGLGGFALVRMQSSAHLLREIGTVWAPAVQQLSEMRALLGEFRTYELASWRMPTIRRRCRIISNAWTRRAPTSRRRRTPTPRPPPQAGRPSCTTRSN
ncbi:MCP four helix bundle domain-containing protein [Xanthomonas phaseoli pv. phaseoli]|nr:MCP four helix bundle domain-containing protein [Xanthomonas phaseoli]UZB30698.1 MCP four helix bundle domain-containing protein [Xanthomonas phaseoli pv. phaseoli]